MTDRQHFAFLGLCGSLERSKCSGPFQCKCMSDKECDDSNDCTLDKVTRLCALAHHSFLSIRVFFFAVVRSVHRLVEFAGPLRLHASR